MTYGIDLGTTYSLIGSGDTLYSGLVSSNVDLATKSQCDRDYIGENVVSGYKVNMTIGASGELPMKCSTIILKELVKRAKESSGEEVKDVIISVPAKFSHTQRLAVIQAGKEAGLTVKAVINEPTAAAIYACLERPGLYLVYDLGGGTFDVSIVSVDSTGARVLCTDGIATLAGNNFDRRILDQLCRRFKVPVRYRNPIAVQDMLTTIQKAKEDFQKDGIPKPISLSPFGMGETYVLDLDEYQTAMQVFEPTITMCKTLLATLMGLDQPKLLFVGGSTACPYLRKWVSKEMQLEVVQSDIQPDLLVAKGVAKFAWLHDKGFNVVQDVTKQLSIADRLGVAQPVIYQDTPLPATGEILLVNPEQCRVLEVDLYQGDDCIVSNNDYIGTLEFDYGELVDEGAGVVNVSITVDTNGIVNLSGNDLRTGRSQTIQLRVR